MRIMLSLLLLGITGIAWANLTVAHFFIGASLANNITQNSNAYLVDYKGDGTPYKDLLIQGKPSQDDFASAVHLGYQWQMNHSFLLNAVASLQLHQKTKFSIANYSYAFNGPNAEHYSEGLEASITAPEYSLSLQPSYVINKNNSVYVALGVEVARLHVALGESYYVLNKETERHRDILPAITKAKTLYAPQFGLGYTHSLTPRLSLNVNVNYAQAKYTVNRSETGGTLIDRTEQYSTILKFFNTEVGIRYLL